MLILWERCLHWRSPNRSRLYYQLRLLQGPPFRHLGGRPVRAVLGYRRQRRQRLERLQFQLVRAIPMRSEYPGWWR